MCCVRRMKHLWLSTQQLLVPEFLTECHPLQGGASLVQAGHDTGSEVQRYGFGKHLDDRFNLQNSSPTVFPRAVTSLAMSFDWVIQSQTCLSSYRVGHKSSWVVCWLTPEYSWHCCTNCQVRTVAHSVHHQQRLENSSLPAACLVPCSSVVAGYQEGGFQLLSNFCNLCPGCVVSFAIGLEQ